MELKRALLITLSVTGLLALLAAVSLVMLTSTMHETMAELASAARIVNIAQQVEIALLSYGDTSEPSRRLAFESEIKEGFTRVRNHARATEVVTLFSEAEKAVDTYLNLARGNVDADRPDVSLALARATSIMSGVIRDNLARLDAVEASSARINTTATWLGILVAAGLLVGNGTILIWIVHYGFKPMLEIREAMRRFSQGDRSARASEAGLAEFRSTAAEFNEMARALEQTRHEQLTFLAAVAHDLRNQLIHRVNVDVPDNSLAIVGDAGRIQQVLNNLVSNAIKYSPKGGDIHISVARVSEDVVISVVDEGVGIPKDQFSKIFQPFHRVPASAENIPGVGLGLSVSRRIVQAHGGQITVESVENRGSTFRVHLPVKVNSRSATGNAA
jgi:signal transduction histidine kinase